MTDFTAVDYFSDESVADDTYPQPYPYWAPEYEPIWAAAEANGLPIFFHVASGGVDSKAGTSATGSQVKGILTAMTMGEQELTGALLAGRTMGGGSTAAASPMRIIADLVSSGVCERHPNLMLNVIEFNAGWLANYMGSMDKAWRTGTGQDPHWWLGFWDDGVDPHDQKLMGRMFKINDRWPLPLKPSEYGFDDSRKLAPVTPPASPKVPAPLYVPSRAAKPCLIRSTRSASPSTATQYATARPMQSRAAATLTDRPIGIVPATPCRSASACVIGARQSARSRWAPDSARVNRASRLRACAPAGLRV